MVGLLLTVSHTSHTSICIRHIRSYVAVVVGSRKRGLSNVVPIIIIIIIQLILLIKFYNEDVVPHRQQRSDFTLKNHSFAMRSTSTHICSLLVCNNPVHRKLCCVFSQIMTMHIHIHSSCSALQISI